MERDRIAVSTRDGGKSGEAKWRLGPSPFPTVEKKRLTRRQSSGFIPEARKKRAAE